MQKEKFLQTTKVHVLELLVENALDESEETELDSHHSNNVDQVMQVEQEKTNNKENINESDHLMEPITSPPPENQIKQSDEKTINQEVLNDDQIIEVPPIDFCFGD